MLFRSRSKINERISENLNQRISKILNELDAAPLGILVKSALSFKEFFLLILRWPKELWRMSKSGKPSQIMVSDGQWSCCDVRSFLFNNWILKESQRIAQSQDKEVKLDEESARIPLFRTKVVSNGQWRCCDVRSLLFDNQMLKES